jgi:hypothetical protein
MRGQIYVALLNEGTIVWRPVVAEAIGPRTHQILGPMPDDEQWQFPPGSLVHCEQRTETSGQRSLVAVEMADSIGSN